MVDSLYVKRLCSNLIAGFRIAGLIIIIPMKCILVKRLQATFRAYGPPACSSLFFFFGCPQFARLFDTDCLLEREKKTPHQSVSPAVDP